MKTVDALGIAKEKVLSSNLKVRSFAGNLTKTLGVLILKVKIGPAELFHIFFVTDCTAPYNIILGRDWIHRAYCIHSTLHQEMLMWDPATDKAELVKADDRPYSVASCILDAEYYSGDMRHLGVAGIDTKGRPIGVTSIDMMGSSTGQDRHK